MEELQQRQQLRGRKEDAIGPWYDSNCSVLTMYGIAW